MDCMYKWSLYSTVVPQSIYWTYPWAKEEQDRKRERERDKFICAQLWEKKCITFL